MVPDRADPAASAVSVHPHVLAPRICAVFGSLVPVCRGEHLGSLPRGGHLRADAGRPTGCKAHPQDVFVLRVADVPAPLHPNGGLPPHHGCPRTRRPEVPPQVWPRHAKGDIVVGHVQAALSDAGLLAGHLRHVPVCLTPRGCTRRVVGPSALPPPACLGRVALDALRGLASADSQADHAGLASGAGPSPDPLRDEDQEEGLPAGPFPARPAHGLLPPHSIGAGPLDLARATGRVAAH
mmetsp:Transcript_30866/g.98492  ORF Transcript_30866/g.98492 Transcript_30866/m.98492 type:complete len:238 (+) Transcript_30866:1110-1823(+)